MKCLMKYQWVKLPRNNVPEGKGIMSAWVRLASRAAFRKGYASYCGHRNPVIPGMWSGGVVGLKSILGIKNRQKALDTLQQLCDLGYVFYDLNKKTKKLDYQIADWVVNCSGAECMDGTAFATEGYGFLCLPRNITERLAKKQYIFEEADAWLDLWCHSVSEDPNNVFSYQAPVIQYGKYGAVLTLETLGQRWGWEKTKVWRFFKKHGDVFALYRLPGSYGCLIFNKLYPTGTEVSLPTPGEIMCILDEIRIYGENVQKKSSDHAHINQLITWYSRRLTGTVREDMQDSEDENRVSLFCPIIRAYFSQCRNCKNYIYDCRDKEYISPAVTGTSKIRGPCGTVDITEIAKEYFTYEQAG